MQSSTPKCPSCESTEMINGGIHGMEHSVCTKCGTVLENEQFTVDVYEGGCKEVKADFDGRHFNYGFILSKTSNQNSRSHRDGLVMLRRLMDGLDLPASVRDAAVDYFRYTKRLNKIASAGAVVYLAMKDFHMPVTIRCIANYLQVSHYTIGRIMRILEKKLEHKRTHGKSFEVNELIPHLFSQAQFGVEEEKKRMLDFVIRKTDQLLCLLKECMATTGYVPHLIALAAGYIVWKHSNITKWNELNIEIDKLPMRPVSHLTVSLFLSEVGISLPSLGQLTSKITLIQKVLSKLSTQIPWLSISESHSVIIHLNDFLKYKSQIIDMTAKDLAEKEKDSNEEILMFEEDNVKSMNETEFLLQPPESSVIETSSLPEESSLSASCSKSKQNCMPEEKNPAERADKSSDKRTSFIRVMDLNLASQSPEKESELLNNKRKAGKGRGPKSNGYDKLLLISHPYMGKRRKKTQSLRVNPLSSFH